jgi:hypothetical protein
VDPAGANGDEDAPLLAAFDDRQVAGGNIFPTVEQGTVQVTDHEADALPDLP